MTVKRTHDPLENDILSAKPANIVGFFLDVEDGQNIGYRLHKVLLTAAEVIILETGRIGDLVSYTKGFIGILRNMTMVNCVMKRKNY